MKMTNKEFSAAYSARVSRAAEAITVIFSHNLLDALKIGGAPLSDLEAGICENSASQPLQSRRAGYREWASSMGNSRIRG
ncbi:hypothetical protein [Stagnihabitans tardus]|uniref:Uncharacterized protein n=1 Tax=Stagnihabitans tardus TaxID=2699202 RepID=A0AAE5BTW4_9RHOB|nr:hypothetical protein [Stagnihabitans tardus]NBZ89510.1 hypothetical protein [Stagnihabitans tardus]